MAVARPNHRSIVPATRQCGTAVWKGLYVCYSVLLSGLNKPPFNFNACKGSNFFLITKQ